MKAAIRAAHYYGLLGHQADAERGLEVLAPFETVGDPTVLEIQAWLHSILGDRDLALAEYKKAAAAAQKFADPNLRSDIVVRSAYELSRDARHEDAVRSLDALLRGSHGTLEPKTERRARLSLARSLDEIGDSPAAEAEIQRLWEFLHDDPPSSLELLLDARLHMEAGQLQSADELFKRAQAVAQVEGRRMNEAFAVLRRLTIAVDQSAWDRVRSLSEEVKPLEDGLTPDGQRQLVVVEAIAARLQGRPEEARALLERARTMSPPPNELWELEYESGMTLKALGQLDDARKAFEQSISIIESQSRDVTNTGLQATLVASRQKPFDALFDVLAEAGDAERALATLQKSLSRRLGTEVAEVSRSAGTQADDALDRTAAQRRLQEANRELPERDGSLKSQDARFVAFVITDAHSWALIHVGGPSLLETIQTPPKELCSSMVRFGEDLDEDTATRLGAALFSASTLKRLGPRFAVLLPTCARNFPVSALRIGDARLVDRAVVSVAPDVSTVTAAASAASSKGAGSRLVLADPHGDLPSARDEAAATAKATGASVLVGDLAAASALQAGGWRLLHFATHTAVDAAGPALVLADRNLTVADILQRRLHADLVVVASCHSGSRLQATSAEALSTAFLRAGSTAVLATLRSVEDKFATEVLRAFYEQGGLDDPAGALARVQRKLARTEPLARWTAFFVAGSPEPLGTLAGRHGVGG